MDESGKLNDAIAKIETFGTDYTQMTEEQQYELGAYVNLMEASTMLIVNPILGLQPKYSKQDFDKLCAAESDLFKRYFKEHKTMLFLWPICFIKSSSMIRTKKLLAKSFEEKIKEIF